MQVWRGKHGDPVAPFGPLPGVRIGDVFAYEWQQPDAFVPWPGRTQLERVYVLLDVGVSLCDPLWREANMPDGRRVEGIGSRHDDPHTWYVDLVSIEHVDDGIYVRDLYADVIVPTDGRHQRMLDLDELADAVEAGLLSPNEAVDGLRRWQRFIDRHLHTGREAGRDWSDFPPAVIAPLQALPAPLGPVVRFEL